MIALQSIGVVNMTSITVRNLDENIKQGLRLRAAKHGWSMEQEVRQLLKDAVSQETSEPAQNFALQVNALFHGSKADDLPIPERSFGRKLPEF